MLAPDHPLASKTQITPEDLYSETLFDFLLPAAQADRIPGRHFRNRWGISPLLKAWIIRYCRFIGGGQNGYCRPAALGGVKVERRGSVVTKTPVMVCGAARMPPCATATSVRRPRRLFARRDHACDHLVVCAERERPIRCTHSVAVITAAPAIKFLASNAYFERQD